MISMTPAQLATVFSPLPLPRPPTAYEQGWDGKHDQYIYTEETLLNWPPIPVFQNNIPGGNQDG